jgi:hypothetical protein
LKIGGVQDASPITNGNGRAGQSRLMVERELQFDDRVRGEFT